MAEREITRQLAAAHARRLVRQIRHASLATLARKMDNLPFVTLVTVACDMAARPILMLSDIADHARNLKQSPRASLLFEDASRRANPQTGPRITLYGTIEALPDGEQDGARLRFLARHPAAAMYAGFGDFRMYAMAVEGGRYVGGFARAMTLHGDELVLGGLDTAPGDWEAAILQMLGSHADLADQLAAAILKRRSRGWSIIGVDPEGLDLQRSNSFSRIHFDNRIDDPDGLQEKILSLV